MGINHISIVLVEDPQSYITIEYEHMIKVDR